MTDNNFIKKITFNEKFLPFGEGYKIKFGGEENMQELIKFYLQNKGIKNFEDNAKRFKINCILGNNGGGKSRLFSGILEYKYLDYRNGLTTEGEELITPKSQITDIKGKNIILDDFFKLSGNRHSSINKDILGNSEGAFLCQAFNFLKSDESFNKIYAEFLNEKLNENNKLNYELKINYGLGKGYNIFTETEEKYIKDFKPDGIDNKEFISFIKSIINSSGFGGTFTCNENGDNLICDCKNILNLFDNELFFYVYLVTSGIIHSMIQSFYKKENMLHDCSGYHIDFLKFSDKGKITEEQEQKQKELLKLIGKKEKSKEDISKILEKIYSKLKNGYSKTIKSSYSLEKYDNKQKFNDKEIEYLGTHFYIDLKFETKNFSDLSAGEKIMLIRFTNIFGEINEYDQKECLILIDEPDLHLHLDWQKKYIQKLIDVFSTLDTGIKLHFIIATHSPFIISDLPVESIILLDKEEGKEYTQIKNYDGNKQNKKLKNKTFGANYIDIIRNGFFFKNNEALMGGFAENIIGEIADKERESIMKGKLKENKLKEDKLKEQIGDDFLRENLLYFKGKNKNAKN